MKPILIIGAGLAGYTLAREFRKLDKTAPLLIMTADDGNFYSKPMLSNAAAQGKVADDLITQNAAQMAAQLGATIMTGTRVLNIDTANRKVETSAGTFEYEKLVLAVGALPIRLSLNGDGAADVLSINHLDDYAAFRRRLAPHATGARITILGAGLIGCEFADDLATAGHDVTLVDPNSLPLASLAPPALSHGLHQALSARGVSLRMGATATRINRQEGALEVMLADGTRHAADVVLSAVGIRPDLRLAQGAGLFTMRGIVLDRFGRTSARDVFALGDCAEYLCGTTGSTLPYVAPLMAAARAIARTLVGELTPIDLKPAAVIVKTPSFPLALVPPPMRIAGGRWVEDRDGERTVCRYIDHAGVTRGFGIAPQDAVVRQALMTELNKGKIAAEA